MEKCISNDIYRKIFMLDEFEGEKDIYHELLCQHSNYKYLITGPRKSGRTSLLFEMAFQAVENAMDVLFISCKQIPVLPHFHGKRNKPSTDFLARIQLVYPKTLEECLTVLGSLHKKGGGYSLIIVDDIENFLQQERKKVVQCCSLLMAILIDSLAYCSKRTGTNAMLLCSLCYDNQLYSRIIETVEHWIQNQIRFYPSPLKNEQPGIFTIKSETKIACLKDQIDVDIVGVQAKFEEDRIFFR